MRSGPGVARTILLFHIISARPSKQPLRVRTGFPVGSVALALTAFLRSNGVIHRTQKVFQVDDNGHVGRPCEVSLAPPCPELFCELRGLCRHSYFGPRTCSRSERPMSSKRAGSQSGFPKKPFSPLMSTFAVSSQHKDAEYRPLVVGMIDSD